MRDYGKIQLESLRATRRELLQFGNDLHGLQHRAIWSLPKSVRDAVQSVFQAVETEAALLRGQIREELSWLAADQYIHEPVKEPTP